MKKKTNKQKNKQGSFHALSTRSSPTHRVLHETWRIRCCKLGMKLCKVFLLIKIVALDIFEVDLCLWFIWAESNVERWFGRKQRTRRFSRFHLWFVEHHNFHIAYLLYYNVILIFTIYFYDNNIRIFYKICSSWNTTAFGLTTNYRSVSGKSLWFCMTIKIKVFFNTLIFIVKNLQKT